MKNIAAWLRFKKFFLNKPQKIWKNVLWTHKTKAEVLPNTSSVMIWVCFLVTGPGHLTFTAWTMAPLYTKVFRSGCEDISQTDRA